MLNRQSILEMFIHKILRTFMLLTNIGAIKTNIELEEFVYNAIIRGDKDCLKKIVHQNRLKYDQTAILRELAQKVKDIMKKEQAKKRKHVQKFYIKKEGRLVKHQIDVEQNNAKENEIKEILKKDKCIDLFRDAYAEMDPTFHVDRNRIEKFTQYKFKKKSRDYLYKKLNLIL